MRDSKKIKAGSFHWEHYVWGVALLWTLVIATSLVWNVIHTKQMILEEARIQARIAFEKDIIYRYWNAMHGGVYALVTEETQPNPYLSHLPERDITTPSGKLLTLINPAYMTRQVHELAKEKYGILGHITSLNPIRSENAPDPWEINALQAFERGETEISSVEKMEGKDYMRLMLPLITEKGCLKCHAPQGYREGDIRGGISVSIPMEPLWAIERKSIQMLALVHILIWLVVLGGIGLAAIWLKKSEQEQKRAEEQLQKAYAELEQRVEERTAELRTINESLQKEITEHKRVQEEATKLQSAVQQVADILFITDHNGIIEYVNPAFEKITGYRKEEVIGKTPRILKSGLMSSEYYKNVWSIIVSGKVLHDEVVNKKKDGDLFFYDQTITPLKDPQGNITHFISTGRDITERKQAEKALQKSKEFTETILNSMDDNISIINVRDFRITGANQSFLTRLGLKEEEIVGKFCYEVTHHRDRPCTPPNDPCPLQEALKTGRHTVFEHIHYPKDGEQVYVEVSASPIKDEKGEISQVIHVVRDITARKRAEKEMSELQEQFRQSQKMEAIGSLAGGVAHDFNNLLTIIKGYSEFSLLDLKEDDPVKENIKEIQKASQRASDLTRQLLAFSRRQVMEMKVLDLNNTLKDLDKMLHRILGEDIELVTLLAEDLSKVKTDSGQIEQVIMNLAVNARDAMFQGGKLTIETANVVLDDAYARAHTAVTPGRYVMVSVSDTGCGMPPEVKEHIFEPFFTTKDKGKGTGLGLSTAYGIVKQSGGNIWVYSEPGRGTTFKIYFPRVDELLEEMGEKVEKKLTHGSETILVVEDEEAVRKLAVRILGKQGYMVLETCDGNEALRFCKEQKGPVHLVLTDVVMPQMNGRQLVEQLLQVCHGIKVLYMSGYTDNAIVHHGVLEKGVNYIQKPFTPDALARKVRDVLDR